MDGIVERGLEPLGDAVEIAGLELLLEVGEEPLHRLLGIGGGGLGPGGGREGGRGGIVRKGGQGDEGGGERAGQQVEGLHGGELLDRGVRKMERVMGVGPT